MFSFFFKRAFVGVNVLNILLIIYFYFIDKIVETSISFLIEEKFIFREIPFLKMVYLVLLIVSISSFSAIDRNQNIDLKQKLKGISSFQLIVIAFSLMGLIALSWMILKIHKTGSDYYQFEQGIFYFIHDYLLILGFAIGGILYLRKLIHFKPTK